MADRLVSAYTCLSTLSCRAGRVVTNECARRRQNVVVHAQQSIDTCSRALSLASGIVDPVEVSPQYVMRQFTT